MHTINGTEIKTIDDLARFASETSLLLFGGTIEIDGVIYGEADYSAASDAYKRISDEMVKV